MGNSFRDNSIGTDPTSVPIIETLDVRPKTKQDKNNKETGKKIIFVIIVVLLMFGVAGGLYFYLNLGQKNKKASNFTLNPITVSQGQKLSEIITDYGNFNDVDLSLCSLDTTEVNINTPGEYTYSVSCYKVKKESTITVKEFNNLKVTTKYIIKRVGSNLVAKSFVSGNSDYNYAFVNDNPFNNTIPGFSVVEVDVSNNEGLHEKVYGFLDIVPENYLMNIECKLDNDIDRIIFDYNQERINNVIRIYEITYNTEDEMVNDIAMIQDGLLTSHNHHGYAVVDYTNMTIRLINVLNDDSLDANYPKTYNEVKSYYESKNYSCSRK